jgi:AraC family transcriptional regulator
MSQPELSFSASASSRAFFSNPRYEPPGHPAGKAGRRHSPWPITDSLDDQANVVVANSAEILVRLLQQTVELAQQMQGPKHQRVVDYLRLAITAHAELSTRPALAAPSPSLEGLAGWQAEKARNLILEQLDSQVLTGTLATACALSRGHFSRMFKKTFGLPPHKWQRQRRLEAAMDLLRDPSSALCDIAIRCGFNDQAHFTRVFKQTTGLTPMVWRRQN